MNKQYEIINKELYTKGDLKGYVNGYISFNYNNSEREHEFLYRFDDEANGKNFELVSIDYGWKVPYIEEVWDQIENELKEYCLTHN